LMSRLKAMPAQEIAAPDDALLAAVLVKLFADRQLTVSEEVVKYLVARIERSCHAARSWVAALDAAALAENRAVTVALVRKLVEHGAVPE
jgi:chromosomal replication initiation ATPase DnaA